MLPAAVLRAIEELAVGGPALDDKWVEESGTCFSSVSSRLMSHPEVCCVAPTPEAAAEKIARAPRGMENEEQSSEV